MILLWRMSNYVFSHLLTLRCVHGLTFLVHLEFTTDEWLKYLHCIILNIQLLPFIVRCASWELVMKLINRLHLMWVIDSKQEHQQNPTLAISNYRPNNSHIRTLIQFKIIQSHGLFIQYSIPYKQPFWLFVWVNKTILLEFHESHTLMESPN